MSTGKTAESVRARILMYAREIEELTRSDASPEKFWEEYMQRVLAAMGAIAGACWLVDERNQLNCPAQVGLREIGFDNPGVQEKNNELISTCLGRGEPVVIGQGDDNESDLPTANSVMLVPLLRDQACVGAIQVMHPLELPKQARAGLLQFLEQMCGLASRYLMRDSEVQLVTANNAEFWEDFERLTLAVHGSLRTDEVCSTAANDTRELLRVDRVTLATRTSGRNVRVQSISGKEAVNRRANLVKGMERLMSAVLSSGQPLFYTCGGHSELPPEIEEPLVDYLEECGTRMLMILPLFPPDADADRELSDEEQREKRSKQVRPLGGILIEQISDSRPRPDLEAATELVAAQVSSALANARRHEQIFLLPLWMGLGYLAGFFKGRKLVWTCSIAAAIGVAGYLMAVVPYEYRVSAHGKLMPVVQRRVFVPEDAAVVEILVEGGDRVKAGDVLVELRSDPLDEKLATEQGELDRAEKEIIALRDQMRDATGDDRVTLEEKLAVLEVDVPRFQRNIARLLERRDALTIRAPIDGVVATFQVAQRLQNRTVNRADVLLEVMDDAGEWRLELEIPEGDSGAVFDAQAVAKAGLPVEFFLRTTPDETFDAELDSLATRADVSRESGAIVRSTASLGRDVVASRRIGAEVQAKIGCGKEPIGYVLFGKVIDTIRIYFWL